MTAIGAVFRAGDQRVAAAELAAIADAGDHLGPAGGSLEVRGGIGLAYRASSLDAPQPVAGDDDLVGVADIRLDNRVELARALGRRDANSAPSPAADAELLLACYREWGEECLPRLLGDFAFALWDGHRRRLVCARDALGVRPLHWARAESALLVASEAQQLVRHPELSRRLDPAALADYLVDRWEVQEQSLFAGVRSLPPGHLLVVDDRGERLRRFWDPYEIGAATSVNGDEAAHRFAELFSKAVQRRAEGCGPACGVLLSGGLDSSAVAVAAAGGRDHPLALYSCSFPDLSVCDESGYSQLLADHLGLSIEKIPAQPEWLLPGDALRPSAESPFVGWQGLMGQALKRLRLRGGRVLLTGHGGDAVVAGSALVYADRLRRGQLGVLREIAEHAATHGLGATGLLGRWGLWPLLPPSVRGRLAAWRSRSPVPDWIDPVFARRLGLEERWQGPPAPDRRESLARSAIQGQIERLDADLRVVHWAQRLAAGHGIEVRHPFLDRRLVEHVLATPPELLFRAGRYKELLRRALRDRLPPEIRDRTGKTAFGPYLDHSWRDVGGDRIRRLVRAPALADLGVVRAERLRQACDDYLEGRSTRIRPHLWAIITAELWLRECADGELPLAPRICGLSESPEIAGGVGELTG